VAGRPGTNLLIGRVFPSTTDVTNLRRRDTFNRGELKLNAPKTASRKCCFFHNLRVCEPLEAVPG